MEKELSFNPVDLLAYLKQKVISILLLSLGTTMLVIMLSFSLDDYYISSARLTIVEDQSAPSGNPAGIFGNFGGGLIGSNPFNKKIEEVEEIVTSRNFFRELITSNPEILNNILYVDSYNKELQRIVYIQGVPATEDVIEKGKLFPLNKIFFDAHSQFLKSFEFIKSLESEFYTISYTHISPVFAKEILDLVINKANQLQKIIEINEANNALDYLLSEITSATNAEVKGSMSKLVEIQLKTKMIANMRENSTIKIIDSPFIPSKKSGPLRAIIAILTFIISIFLTIPFYAFLYSYNLNTRSDKQMNG